MKWHGKRFWSGKNYIKRKFREDLIWLCKEKGLLKITSFDSECNQPMLEKFEGRPKDITPKARFRSWFG